jgi:hypothetical protein
VSTSQGLLRKFPGGAIPISMEIVCGVQTICWTKKSNTPGKERKKENQSVGNQSASKDRS